MDFIKGFGYVATFLLLVNAILYIKILPRQGKVFTFFTIYLIGVLIIQVLNNVLGPVLHLPNLFLSNIYLVFQFIMLSLLYQKLLNFKPILVIGGLVVFLLMLQYSNNPELLTKYNVIGLSSTQAILTIYCIAYLFTTVNQKDPDLLVVNIGLLLYLVSSTLIFASGNLVFNLNIPKESYLLLLKLNAVLYLIFQILILIEWRKIYYKKMLKSSS
ncbi:hypothetical protein [Aquimarina brevivitae]|uniref:YhhN-like protein n=1 Tax=Aquimarina brevivitae TaxID=323412 RepID=A0A4Q7NUB8_9FLAO|nr:hypothetical protein [Aquimarina brevivitae]RZS90757.1 hypothetical protein EV197_3288 [Aquimarina brevivitae]